MCNQSKGNGSICGFVLKKVINFRLNDSVLLFISLTTGFLAIAMHTVPILRTDWLKIVEPKMVDKEDANGDTINLLYQFDAGYFQVCRDYIYNPNLTVYFFQNESYYFQTECHWSNSFYDDELSDYSTATLAILQRFFIPSTMQIIGAFLTATAFFLTLLGFYDKSAKILYSGILYEVGAIIVTMSVLNVVCIVDDEMSSRIKPNAAGEMSLYRFSYAWGFFSSALSFLPFQVCTYIQVALYLRQFQSLDQIEKVVPQLSHIGKSYHL
uniref:Uncharacterized protein n=1 Tax=Rhabditophanes sp. KR3021 TaxID=114890 RepID=A0AC35TYY4_9BILA